MARIECVPDFLAVGARYHDKCHRKLYGVHEDSSEKKSLTAIAVEFIGKYIIQHKDEFQFSIKSILQTFDGDTQVDLSI